MKYPTRKLAIAWLLPLTSSLALPAQAKPLTQLLETGDASYQAGAAIITTSGTSKIIKITVSGEEKGGRKTEIDYELSCAALTFRQLRVVEDQNGNHSECTSISEPITLNPKKHLVPAALFGKFCRE